MTEESKTRIRVVVDGVELTVDQTGNSVSVHRVVARDRRRKIDITSGRRFSLDDPAAIILVEKMKWVAALQTARCTCDYRYGYSDHAEHCQSIDVATYDGARDDD
jgi:hypothetical protein